MALLVLLAAAAGARVVAANLALAAMEVVEAALLCGAGGTRGAGAGGRMVGDPVGAFGGQRQAPFPLRRGKARIGVGGATARIRTEDLLFTKQLLYH